MVEVYIDDIVVKRKTREEHTQHLQEVFCLLRRYNMKLNSSKCAFDVSAGKFLGRFIARFTDKLRPFFLMLREAGATGWTDNCQSAFKEIKHYLRQPPILSNPQLDERLYIAMADAETRYSKVEQTILALQSVAQKLRSYFQAHPVVVLTNQPF
ncbi:hypothetical protein CK203_039590 [Vitis vinifera]|uniref:Reverse transcriptase domain-containing protein n=1 Tax=Vitis vinifera TaxID=29760 RepID=A0A438HFP6_VITVI|nr:hypothetical protein CK203_039590 [Vitis vinifera]